MSDADRHPEDLVVQLSRADLVELLEIAESYPFVVDRPWKVSTDHDVESIRTGHRRYYDLRSNLRWAVRTLFPSRAPEWSRQLFGRRPLPARLLEAARWLGHTNPDVPDAVVADKIIAYWHEDGMHVATFDPPTAAALCQVALAGHDAQGVVDQVRQLVRRHRDAGTAGGLLEDLETLLAGHTEDTPGQDDTTKAAPGAADEGAEPVDG